MWHCCYNYCAAISHFTGFGERIVLAARPDLVTEVWTSRSYSQAHLYSWYFWESSVRFVGFFLKWHLQTLFKYILNFRNFTQKVPLRLKKIVSVNFCINTAVDVNQERKTLFYEAVERHGMRKQKTGTNVHLLHGWNNPSILQKVENRIFID